MTVKELIIDLLQHYDLNAKVYVTNYSGEIELTHEMILDDLDDNTITIDITEED